MLQVISRITVQPIQKQSSTFNLNVKPILFFPQGSHTNRLWFWLRGWPIHTGAICSGTAPLFWNFISEIVQSANTKDGSHADEALYFIAPYWADTSLAVLIRKATNEISRKNQRSKSVYNRASNPRLSILNPDPFSRMVLVIFRKAAILIRKLWGGYS